MPATLWKSGTINAFSSTLNGNVNAGDSSITLTSTTGLVAPGILVIDRVDANGAPTLNREYISFTGISTNTITGVSRGLAGSSDQGHSSGGIIEEPFTTTHWTDLITYLRVGHDASGGHVISTATIDTARILLHLNASGASISGSFPIHPVWRISGSVSVATTSVGAPLPMPQGGEFQFFSAALRTPVSGASLVLDINKNFTTIFTNQATRISIPGGGTFVSTASFAVKSFSAGDIFTVDIDNGGGTASDLTIIGRGA